MKPLLWWRYRDDVFDVWTHGLPKLLEFTKYINSLYLTIKFELVYSEYTLNVLDLTLHLQDGFSITDIYAKPTDSHLYLPFSSSHPAHCRRAFPYGVALRIRRNCSTDEFLNKRCVEYKGYLKSQGYSAVLVDNQFDRALNHQVSFNKEARKNDTELSKHIWQLKSKEQRFTIKWKILAKAKPYSNLTKRCNLCTAEKHFIITKPAMATLNKRNELISTCRHRRKFILRCG